MFLYVSITSLFLLSFSAAQLFPQINISSMDKVLSNNFGVDRQEPETLPLSMSRLKNRKKDTSCTDEALRKIMHEHITDEMSESKRSIHSSITKTFDGRYAVICAECSFSYIAHTLEYCVHTRYNITCLVFRDG